MRWGGTCDGARAPRIAASKASALRTLARCGTKSERETGPKYGRGAAEGVVGGSCEGVVVNVRQGLGVRSVLRGDERGAGVILTALEQALNLCLRTRPMHSELEL